MLMTGPAPFAKVVYEAVSNADITKPTKDPVPYIGIQYVAIPEFQGIGTVVGQQIAAALSGQTTVDQALQTARRRLSRASVGAIATSWILTRVESATNWPLPVLTNRLLRSDESSIGRPPAFT